MSEATEYLWDNIIPVCDYCEYNHTKECAQFRMQCEALWRYMKEIEQHEADYEEMAKWHPCKSSGVPKGTAHYIVTYTDGSLGLVHYTKGVSGRRLVDDQDFTVDQSRILAYRKVPKRYH